MRLELTQEATDLVRRKGGRVALDFVRGVGCGKTSEVAVDTYLRSKDTSTYHLVEHEGVEVLISPTMGKVSELVRVDTKGAALWRRLVVDVALDHEHGPSCRH